MRVLLRLRPAVDVVAAVADPGVQVAPGDVTGDLPGFTLDPTFAPVAVPQPIPPAGGDPLSLRGPLTYSAAAEDASVLVRGEIADDEVAVRMSLLPNRGAVTGVFSDPQIETSITCGGDPALGSWNDVEQLLHVPALGAASMDGTGVAVAIVDTGINAAFVAKALGKPFTLDKERSWMPQGMVGTPGELPVNHGTMCAFDTLIAAPRATLLDVPVLLTSRQGDPKQPISGLLSDAVAAYSHLYNVVNNQPADARRLVVSNSWGVFRPEWDLPPGNPGNYTDNAAHPFNVIVGSLEDAGADILFAAGNCGRDCPDGRCGFPNRPINGANSHPSVLSIAGIDTKGERVGYSSQGPGRLAERKPDFCAYTHFAGSRAFGKSAADTGTSAACPVAAGLVAAIRTQWPTAQLSPSQLRTLLRRTADDRSTAGFDNDYGYGVPNVDNILAALQRRDARTGSGPRSRPA